MIVLFQNLSSLYFSRSHTQSKDGILSAKWSFTLNHMTPCFQSQKIVYTVIFYSNLIFMFPINNVYNLHIPSNHCFQSTNFVSNLNSLFPLYFFCFLSHNHVYHQSTYYRNKYFWNVKNGFWIIQVCIFISFNGELFFKKVIYGLSENFFWIFQTRFLLKKS